MEGKATYIIHFIYDVKDHALKFPLKAEVEGIGDGVYTITNIRMDSHEDGTLLPPIKLKKEDGQWVFLDNGEESNLSRTIGEAIEARINSIHPKAADGKGMG